MTHDNETYRYQLAGFMNGLRFTQQVAKMCQSKENSETENSLRIVFFYYYLTTVS